MGKAKKKRIKARERKMKGLIETNPRGFMAAWKKLLESRIAIIYIGANRIKAEEIANMVFEELHILGHDAVGIALEYTASRLNEAIARTSNTPKNLYNVGNFWQKIEDSHRRGARASYGTNNSDDSWSDELVL